ncbi:hypothetical protein J3458_005647 [Metarhizium acridum]|uniref:Kinetoplast-associated protein KAP n=1 Tax=Metarhizium acridum (strain CQMa 102) TaxID=655827 RepID=E9E1X6_METAQ|nr:uncharacterized protein MAC_03831 [Metarhizium acridum CQMa 102]EFY90073.1 hypothetical protein MAC_03831 [Metarhizium acridum CQMa 102]KAG8418222.1 hypothetical protein J3458_005647 [Metarhizium acridum]
MTSPLSPVPEASINRATPPSKRKYEQYEVRAFTSTTTTTSTNKLGTEPLDDSGHSSPFLSSVNETSNMGQENVSPSKARHSRVISGTELSPLKILGDQKSASSSSTENGSMGPPPQRSPRKMSPVARFPIKISPMREDDEGRAMKERKISVADMVRSNEGLKKAIDIFEDESELRVDADADTNAEVPPGEQEHDDAAAPDESMISTFSTFSVVPNLTVFAKLGQSPTRSGLDGHISRSKLQQDSFARPVSPSDSTSNTTNLLMDFTDQMRFPQQKSPGKRGALSPSRTMPGVSETPNRQVTNLIDFDIPPLPTPRSLPSITPRELESLKSGFLSEISSLKASLSGKEAEVHSLKTAVGDAEKRVGESMEQLREERGIREQLSAEKEDWEKRGRDMENVLRKIREEVMTSQREREELEQKLEESEKRREAAEMLHQEAESKMAGMRAGKDSEKTKDAFASPEKAKATSNKEVEIAVERVARELHALYKGKHETKVAALKKSYEARWEKRVKDMERRIEELSGENTKLRENQEANLTRLEPDNTQAEERKAQAAKDSAAIKELNADVQRLEAVISTVKKDNTELRTMLERERVEKGELVQLAEEMMSMQSFVGGAQQQRAQQQQQQQERTDLTKTPRASGEYAKSSNVGRSGGSGIRAPGSAIRPPGHVRRGSGGLPRPGRSGIMSSIEKMGSYRGRGQD